MGDNRMKVINNPCECGYIDQEPNWRDTKCRHPKQGRHQIICDNPVEFPDNCPLQNCLYPQSINKKTNEK